MSGYQFQKPSAGLPSMTNSGAGRGPDPSAPTYGDDECINRVNVGRQARTEHPLERFGWSRPPDWIWRRSQRLYMAAMACRDIWLIARGRITLHRAYQVGYDHGHVSEVERTLRGGR